MKLSQHFHLEEFVRSQIAERMNIDNTPQEHAHDNLHRLAFLLEEVRDCLDHNPMYITSGYRCATLNAILGSPSNSSHTIGLAADFLCPGYGSPKLIVKRLSQGPVLFDQLILEGSRNPWVHIGFAVPMRNQILEAKFSHGAATYSVYKP